MPAIGLHQILPRARDFSAPSEELSKQWKKPSDVFSVLLLLGGDVIERALAQLVGSALTPVAFSFGWVAYAVTAVVSAVGEDKLMPLPDCSCMVINGSSGYARDNCSWILGRIVRDFEYWMDAGNPDGPIKTCVRNIIDEKWRFEKARAEKVSPGSGSDVSRPSQSGLCVSIYKAQSARPGYPGCDMIYFIGFGTVIVQLAIAAVPCGLYGDWAILLITAAGITLAFVTGSLQQWAKEKWACREKTKKNFVLTRGNSSQHAIVILSQGCGLDLEDLAAGPSNVDVSASHTTRIVLSGLAVLWILLLITATGIEHNTWFLLAVGGLGMLQNIYVAGCRRTPDAFGIPLEFVKVIGKVRVMDTLFAVEDEYPKIGSSMLSTYFPGKLTDAEEIKWKQLNDSAKERMKENRQSEKHYTVVT